MRVHLFVLFFVFLILTIVSRKKSTFSTSPSPVGPPINPNLNILHMPFSPSAYTLEVTTYEGPHPGSPIINTYHNASPCPITSPGESPTVKCPLYPPPLNCVPSALRPNTVQTSPGPSPSNVPTPTRSPNSSTSPALNAAPTPANAVPACPAGYEHPNAQQYTTPGQVVSVPQDSILRQIMPLTTSDDKFIITSYQAGFRIDSWIPNPSASLSQSGLLSPNHIIMVSAVYDLVTEDDDKLTFTYKINTDYTKNVDTSGNLPVSSIGTSGSGSFTKWINPPDQTFGCNNPIFTRLYIANVSFDKKNTFKIPLDCDYVIADGSTSPANLVIYAGLSGADDGSMCDRWFYIPGGNGAKQYMDDLAVYVLGNDRYFKSIIFDGQTLFDSSSITLCEGLNGTGPTQLTFNLTSSTRYTGIMTPIQNTITMGIGSIVFNTKFVPPSTSPQTAAAPLPAIKSKLLHDGLFNNLPFFYYDQPNDNMIVLRKGKWAGDTIQIDDTKNNTHSVYNIIIDGVSNVFHYSINTNLTKALNNGNIVSYIPFGNPSIFYDKFDLDTTSLGAYSNFTVSFYYPATSAVGGGWTIGLNDVKTFRSPKPPPSIPGQTPSLFIPPLPWNADQHTFAKNVLQYSCASVDMTTLNTLNDQNISTWLNSNTDNIQLCTNLLHGTSYPDFYQRQQMNQPMDPPYCTSVFTLSTGECAIGSYCNVDNDCTSNFCNQNVQININTGGSATTGRCALLNTLCAASPTYNWGDGTADNQLYLYKGMTIGYNGQKYIYNSTNFNDVYDLQNTYSNPTVEGAPFISCNNLPNGTGGLGQQRNADGSCNTGFVYDMVTDNCQTSDVAIADNSRVGG